VFWTRRHYEHARECDHSLERRADRLRLTLTSLACQSEPPKVVVNDGSSDHTKGVIATAEGVNIVALHNATPAGAICRQLKRAERAIQAIRDQAELPPE